MSKSKTSEALQNSAHQNSREKKPFVRAFPLISLALAAAGGLFSAFNQKPVQLTEETPNLPTKHLEVKTKIGEPENPKYSFKSLLLQLQEDPLTALAFPLAVKETKERSVEKIITINIPTEYYSVNPTNQEETERQLEEMSEFISRQLESQLPLSVRSSFGNKTLADLAREIEENGITIKRIAITGSSSPEFIKGGINSIENKDSENQRLARERAEFGALALERSQFGKDQKINVLSQELPFTAEDKKKILRFTQSMRMKGLETSQIFEVAKMVNSKNPAVPKEVENIFKNKRNIAITLEIEGKEKEVQIVGIPAFLLILINLSGLLSLISLPKIKKNPFSYISFKLPPSIPTPRPAPSPKPTPPEKTQTFKEPKPPKPIYYKDTIPKDLPLALFGDIDPEKRLKVDKFIADRIGPKSIREDGLKLRETFRMANNIIGQALNLKTTPENSLSPTSFHMQIIVRIQQMLELDLQEMRANRQGEKDYSKAIGVSTLEQAMIIHEKIWLMRQIRNNPRWLPKSPTELFKNAGDIAADRFKNNTYQSIQ